MKNEQNTEQPFETLVPDIPLHRDFASLDNYDERLNHLLEVATQIIAREGYHNASMRKVAKEAGVSLAGLYHYFDSKEEMLFLIQFRSFSSLLSNLKEKLQSVDNPVNQLRVMINEYVIFFSKNLMALKVCSHELDSLSGSKYETCRKIRHEYYLQARAIIDQILITQTSNSHLDRRIATMSLFGTMNWLYRWYNPKRDCAPKTLAKQISDQFLLGLLTQPEESHKRKINS